MADATADVVICGAGIAGIAAIRTVTLSQFIDSNGSLPSNPP